jgi:hypothetical protein
MSALVYILSRSFKNIIKGLIRKPAALIAYVIIAGFILLTVRFINFSRDSPSTRMTTYPIR